MTTLDALEFEGRGQRVAAAAAEAGFDALIAYSAGNSPGPVAYLAGYETSFGLSDVAFLVLVPGTTPRRTLVTNSYWDDVEHVARVDEIVVTRSHVEAIDAILPRTSQRVGLVGFDLFPARVFNALTRLRPGTTFEDATPLVQQLARIKSPAEVAMIRRAVELSDAGGRRFAAELAPGRSDREIQEAVDHTIMDGGADGLAFRTFVMSGPRIATGIGFPSGHRLSAGEQVNLLCGARVAGYRVELGRVAAVGRPPDDLLHLMDGAADMHDAMRSAMAPGVAVNAVTEAGLASARGNGLADHVWAPLQLARDFGHGMGCWVSEPPLLREDSSELLQPGMTLSVEARLSVPGKGGAVITEMVLITPDGAERLSSLPLRIWQ